MNVPAAPRIAYDSLALGRLVARHARYRIELLTLLWACAKLGAAIVPLSTLLNGPGIASLLTDAKARVLVAAVERGPMLEAVLAGLGDARPVLLLARKTLKREMRAAFWEGHDTRL